MIVQYSYTVLVSYIRVYGYLLKMTNFVNFIISNEEVAYIIQYQKLQFNFTKVIDKRNII